jgi:hypothetical protein
MYKVALGTKFLPVLQFSHVTKYSTIVTVVCDSCPTTRHEGAWGERRFSSYSFSTSALDWGEWSASCPRERTPVPIVQEVGWAPEPVWTLRIEEKYFRLCLGSNLDRPVVQPVARHYTD